MESRLNRLITKRAFGLISLLALGVVSAHAVGVSQLVEHVRAANDRFKDVAVAVAEGYTPIPCASGLQGGAMGVHYVSGERLKDGVIDLAKPEAVMYEPMPDGTMSLVAVEYIAFKGPAALEGHLVACGSTSRYAGRRRAEDQQSRCPGGDEEPDVAGRPGDRSWSSVRQVRGGVDVPPAQARWRVL